MSERLIEYEMTEEEKAKADALEPMRTLADAPAGGVTVTHEQAMRARAVDYPWSLAYSAEEFREGAARGEGE